MNNKSKAILFSLSAAFFFSCMSASVKLAGDLPAIEKAIFRNLVSCLIAFILVKKSGFSLFGKRENLKRLILRSTFGTLGLVANYYAIDHLILADSNMLNKLAPFFTIIFSYILLKERVNKVQIIGLIIALTGGLFVVKPTFNSSVLPSLVGVSSGVFAGLAYTLVRSLGGREKGPTIVFFFSFFSTVVLLPFTIMGFVMPTPKQLLLLLLAGSLAATGQFSITAAYNHAAAKDISIYDYSQILFSSLIGFIIFNQIPDGYSFIGYILIFTSSIGVFIINRESKKR